MQPDALGLAAVGDRGHGVDRGRRRRPDRRDDRTGAVEVEQVGPQPERVVDRGLAQLQLEQLRGLVHGRVRVLGADDGPRVGSRGAGRRERDERARRGGVLDVAVQPGRKPEELREPVERHLLELLQRGRRAPEDPDLVEARDQELGEDAGLGAGGREVREEARALPVRDPGHEHVVEVAENSGERLGLVRRRSGQRGPHRARLDLREHGPLAHALEVGRDPVERRGAVVAKRSSLAQLRTICAPRCACSGSAPSSATPAALSPTPSSAWKSAPTACASVVHGDPVTAGFSGEPRVRVAQVEPVGLRVDLERGARLRRALDDLLDVDVGARTA